LLHHWWSPCIQDDDHSKDGDLIRRSAHVFPQTSIICSSNM
jgi:hypothetical protein